MDRLITHLLVLSLVVHVSLELEGGSPGATLDAVVGSALVESVGAMGVAGAARLLEVWVEVVEKLDGTFQCLLKVLCASMFSRFGVCLVRL